MKKYLIDPSLQWHKANMHNHTNQSDGYYSPADIKKYYMEKGYSIVCFTDHEIFYDNSYLNDDNFIAINASEYSITFTNDKDGNPLKWKDMKAIHLNIYSPYPNNLFHPATYLDDGFIAEYKAKYGKTPTCDGHQRVATKESVQDTIDRCNKAGFLVQLNHPDWSLLEFDDYSYLKGLWGFEIYNYATDIHCGAEYNPYIYNDFIRRGNRLFCTMGDDNHNSHGDFEDSFGGYCVIGVPKLTYENVFNALKSGNFYSSMGPEIKSILYDSDNKTITVECSEAVAILYNGTNRIYRHKTGKNVTKYTLSIPEGDTRFKIMVRDKYNRIATTNYYFINEIEGSKNE